MNKGQRKRKNKPLRVVSHNTDKIRALIDLTIGALNDATVSRSDIVDGLMYAKSIYAQKVQENVCSRMSIT